MFDPTQVHNPESPTITSGGDGNYSINGTPVAAPTGYELEALIGEGGMGLVYRARELAMNRDVAVKILQGRYAPESSVGKRFVEEARITAQLQHPGIPPIHQVGTLTDGRPFLAMKLIKGDTLDELLKKRKDPGTDRGRYLAIFEQIAQAVGYAHAHSVIHRDLKPANIMVGSFGEVQVMDWGLAKVLGAGQQPETLIDDAKLGTEIRSLRDGAETTQAGSLLGTPAFMPPEQAIGAIDQVSERSDVFGLGAILCVILTGQPPFVSESSESTRLKAARAKLDEAFARLDGSGAEPELITLTKRCLAPEPVERPKDAGEVAEAISALRADAERRARQAEMERARAEVRSAEERKRRRVKLALVLTLLTLVAVAGFAAWGIESVRAERKAEDKKRQDELHLRQMATERDVSVALKEALVLREEGWKQADDPARWALTLSTARSSYKRAEALLSSGEPDVQLRELFETVGKELSEDERDRALLAELDKIEEESDIRFMIPVMLNSRYADRYADAFRRYGVDLLAMPAADAAAWLKVHRFRERLITAVRNWQYVRPVSDVRGPGFDFNQIQSVYISAAVTGAPAVQALMNRPSIRDRLNAILKGVNDDPFTREWWDAVGSGNIENVRKLFTRPEFNRLTSRELSSLVDALSNYFLFLKHDDVIAELLTISHDRFPGDYWVNFRLGSMSDQSGTNESDPEERSKSIRYLSAAVAARPQSAMPRVALGMNLLRNRKDDPQGFRLLRGAAALDPTNPWPHLMLGLASLEIRRWPDMFAAFHEAARIDPEIGFFMIFSLLQFDVVPEVAEAARDISQNELARFYEEMVAQHPEQAGGYMLRGNLKQQNGDYRSALADYRKAIPLFSSDAPFRGVASITIGGLGRIARWEEKLPAVLKREIYPGSAFELLEVAEYCAGFEQRYVLAVRFVSEALAADPNLHLLYIKVPLLAGWALKAAAGKGVDAANLNEIDHSRLRKKALAWIREALSRLDKRSQLFLANLIVNNADFAPVRDPEALAKLPPDERAEWTRFWAELPKKEKKLDVAPAPRSGEK